MCINRGDIFAKARSTEVDMHAEIVYRGYGLTFCTTYNIYSLVIVQP